VALGDDPRDNPRVVGAIREKPVYFAAVAVALVCFPLLLRRQGWSQASRFAGFFAAAFLLYNGFLMVTYVAHFSPEMSADAHSYFRYNTHLSLVLVLVLALAARELVPAPWASRRGCRWAAAFGIVLALLAPVAFAERLRFDIAMPQPLVWDLAGELKPYLKDGDRLAILAPGDDGEIGRLLGDYLASAPPRRRSLDLLQRNTATQPPSTRPPLPATASRRSPARRRDSTEDSTGCRRGWRRCSGTAPMAGIRSPPGRTRRGSRCRIGSARAIGRRCAAEPSKAPPPAVEREEPKTRRRRHRLQAGERRHAERVAVGEHDKVVLLQHRGDLRPGGGSPRQTPPIAPPARPRPREPRTAVAAPAAVASHRRRRSARTPRAAPPPGRRRGAAECRPR